MTCIFIEGKMYLSPFLFVMTLLWSVCFKSRYVNDMSSEFVIAIDDHLVYGHAFGCYMLDLLRTIISSCILQLRHGGSSTPLGAVCWIF